MVRRPIRRSLEPRAGPTPAAVAPSPPKPISTRTLALVVAGLLIAHYALAASSLLRENPTVDEVNHLPAGVSCWETGSFRLYHHNPPLIKLVAALPVVLAGGRIKAYESSTWMADSFISPVLFGHFFALRNASRYFELFTLARLVMPLFSVLGGLVVFAWARRLFGDRGGLLSLALWCLCPNILAHARLITSDVGATSLGVAATYAFWRYLHQPTWKRAALAGLVLGVAQLSKFSLLLLYPLWPMLWIIFEVAKSGIRLPIRTVFRATGQGAMIVAASVLTINLGYGFEGTGRPLGSFRFISGWPLTRERAAAGARAGDPFELAWQHRENRFRKSWLGRLPVPMPDHYVRGFDEQKFEADGLPLAWIDPAAGPGERTGYSVYLDGVMRRTGWRSYYALAFLYKTPEGTLGLLAIAVAVFAVSRRSRAGWGDEAVVLVIPLTVFGAMTFLTDINIGLRYVLPVFPYLFVFAGRVAPWLDGFQVGLRRLGWSIVLVLLAMTAASTLAIHPHYLAHMNWLSGGPDRDPPRLIDSNLDWGQDLVGLREWLRAHPDEGPVGLVYFGQVSPNIFALRGDGFAWFLPPPRPRSVDAMPGADLSKLAGWAPRLTPGLYAVSGSMRQGLSWRIYDPSQVWAGTWNARDGAYDYFRELTPFHRIGHSILLFRVTEAQAARLNARLGLASSP